MSIQWNITQGLVCCGEIFIGVEIKFSNLERDLVKLLESKDNTFKICNGKYVEKPCLLSPPHRATSRAGQEEGISNWKN